MRFGLPEWRWHEGVTPNSADRAAESARENGYSTRSTEVHGWQIFFGYIS